MKEDFLHFIWKYQKFESTNLFTTSSQKIIVLSPGDHNYDSGPDFENARIKIDDLIWAGSIEIHIDSSHWSAHNHHNDRSYDNVILHVVWNDNQPLKIQGNQIPTLELKNLVGHFQIQTYESFINQKDELLCKNHLPNIKDLWYRNMLDKTLIERLMKKSESLNQTLHEYNNDWEEVTYIHLAMNFGFSINSNPFHDLSKRVPYKVISKYFSKDMSMEALLFGMAGFLDDQSDDYQSALAQEFGYLRSKHKLKANLKKHVWKFGKMRPSNFPTVRLAQFSGLLSKNQHLFSKIIEINSVENLIKAFNMDVSSYWQQHYDFAKPSKFSGKIGVKTQENILINTVAPILVAYSKYADDQRYLERATQLLDFLSPESNRITKKWVSAGKKPMNASDSQAMIELYKNYCQRKKCLHCNIGASIFSK